MMTAKEYPLDACKKCGGEMKRGIATGQAWSGVADFPGDRYAMTISPSGPGYLMPCLKCSACGWSVTLCV